jgi:hypothetical protein
MIQKCISEIYKTEATAHNRTVYASGAVAPSGFRFARSATPPTLNSTHIFAVAGNLRFPLSQPQKRHIQPERYVQYALKYFKKFV